MSHSWITGWHIRGRATLIVQPSQFAPRMMTPDNTFLLKSAFLKLHP